MIDNMLVSLSFPFLSMENEKERKRVRRARKQLMMSPSLQTLQLNS